MASHAPAEADTFPKLLIRNARNFGNRPAMRHKDLGIWQTLTWAQLLDEVRAYAVGLHRLGLQARRHHGDRRRQPAEALCLGDGGAGARRRAGAGLCRRGGGRAVLRAGARRGALRRGRGPGAGRQDLVGVGPAAEARDHGLRRAAGLARLRPHQASRHGGRHRRRPQGSGGGRHARRLARSRDRGGQGLRHLDHPLHLRHHRAVQGRGAVGGALHRRQLRHRRLRQADRDGRGAGLSAARLGRRPLSQLRAGAGRGLLHGLPGERRHRDGGSARDRADVLLRAAAHLRADADPRDDPHGGRELPQAPPVSLFHRRGAALRRGDPQQAAGAAARPAARTGSATSWSMAR